MVEKGANMSKKQTKKGKKHEKKANPDKKVCLVEGQIKTLIDAVRGKSDCDAANEYIENLDRRYDPDNYDDEKDMEETLLDKINKVVEDLFK